MPRKRRGAQEEPEPEKGDEGQAQPEAEQPQVPCPHGSHDGQACCLLDCHVAEAPARVETLVRQRKAEIEASVEFRATFKGAAISEKGELKVTLIPSIGDPYIFARDHFQPHAGRAATVYLAFAPEAVAGPLTGQQALGFDGPRKPEPVDMIVCTACKRIARAEGEEPGKICGFCAEGELQIISVIPLTCSSCRQPQELASSQPGDTCTLCKEGRYLAGDQQAPDVVQGPSDLIRFIPPSRVDEMADAVCGLELANDRIAKCVVAIGDDRFVISEATSADPITFEAWRAVPMDEFDGEYHEDGSKLEHLRVTLPESDGVPGAAFVLVGPALRVIVQPEDEPATEQAEAGEEEAD